MSRQWPARPGHEEDWGETMMSENCAEDGKSHMKRECWLRHLFLSPATVFTSAKKRKKTSVAHQHMNANAVVQMGECEWSKKHWVVWAIQKCSSSFTHRLFLQMNEWINKKRRAEDILLSYFYPQKRSQSSHSTLKWLSKPGKLQIISVKHWEEPNYFLHGPPEKTDLAPISDRQGKRQELMARMDWAECSHSTTAESLTTSVTILSADSCHRTADRYWRIHFISGECLLTDHLLNLSHFFFSSSFFCVAPANNRGITMEPCSLRIHSSHPIQQWGDKSWYCKGKEMERGRLKSRAGDWGELSAM